ncbi:diphthine--ammonia ligase isoform X2 [Phragmites australis]|uniref:diphthine--ammonia ligase isoform X2 n=1 Tax=Phragmites australis TaxID=29695 RepID=UPI002D79EAA5|nr:diphthine--ammonia ligase isoform X2 [Phragmites australis]
MEVVALVSGGKDSCFAMMRCLDYGHKVVALANLIPLDDAVDELDSYMYQTVGHQIVVSYAKCMGLPLFRRRIRGSTRDQGLKYNVTAGDEVEDMFALLSEVKRQIPSISAVSSGAIASDYQRLRVESVCSRLGLVSLAYLWKQDQTLLLEEMMRRGIVAITVKVAAMGLKPSSHLGKELAELKCHLLQMNESYGINVCGEGGEYETLTLDCPLFRNARIILDDSEVILHSADSIASVGILHPLAFHLEHKPDSSDRIRVSADSQESSSLLYEVDEGIAHTDVEEKQTLSPAPTVDAYTNIDLCISKTGKNLLSIGCWIQDPSNASEGLKEDLVAVLSRIDNQLKEEGLGWVNVLYVHLYISSMKEFGLANEVYVSFITEKKCYLGVPSRSTIELPLVQAGLGKAYVEVLVSNELVKRVLHVQSISCWAPSCIGPYSQATLYGEILYMAGQLGLDPPTMKLCPGGPMAELELALQNSEAVASAFSCSIYYSAIHFLVYCSSHLTSDEREEVEQTLQSSYITRLDCSKTGSYPTVLYVFAPDLPKGALVEIKPILYVPTNNDEVATREMESGVPQPALSKAWSDWGAQYSDLHDSCCQIHIIGGRICSAVVSITSEIASKICSTAKQLDYSEEHLKVLARFCVFQLAKILVDNKFSWDSIKMLRFYYSVEHSVAADVMSHAFSVAFTVLAENNSSLQIDGVPPYNIVPVSGSGRSACMNDILTFELLASIV